MDLDFSLFYIPRVGTRCSIRILAKRFAWFWQIPLRSKNFALRANPNVTKFSCSVLTLVLPTQRDVHGKFCYTFTGGQENQQEIIKILKVFLKAKSILNRSDLKFWIIKYLQDTFVLSAGFHGHPLQNGWSDYPKVLCLGCKNGW